ncbi:hypothetical protein MTsPCn5_19180 [Croceitalea sp. MTPC5]|uniref:hypothetical protein n=1 Tax=Croceitalea sp. MTPC5 TaxID=3056565 RepID=UPI002B3A9777|nr:hypothetical protein MTsPCn5_19180 [Croceitalea sp. MTPC5]
MKNFILLVVVSILFITACSDYNLKEELDLNSNDDQEIAEPNNQALLQYGKTSADKIPNVIQNLERFTGKSSKAGKSISYQETLIDMSTIEWVIDNTTEETNYTFPIYIEGTSDNEFYNLIMTVSQEGEVLHPYVRRYVVAEHALAEYRASDYDFGKFQGKFYTYDFYDFFDAFEFDGKGKTSFKMPPDCNEDGSAVGATSSSPIENPHLIQDDWYQLWGPESTIPTGSISFSSLWESYTVYTAGSYQNSGSSSQYEEAVQTSGQGVVFLGYQNPIAPYVTYTNTTFTSFNVTSNQSSDGNSFVLGPDVCTTRVNITVTFSDGNGISITYYADCEAIGPINKSGGSFNAKSGCDDGPTQVVAINKRTYANLFNRLCPDTNSTSFLDLIADYGNATALSNYLTEKNVQCADNSAEKAFALEAMIAFSQGSEVDFENEIIRDESFLGTKADCVLSELLNQSGYFQDVMDAFTSDNSDYKIRFTVGTVQDGADAQTSEPDENGIITITFRASSAEARDLEVAGLLLHEGVHAQLFRVLSSGNRLDYNLTEGDYNWLIELNEWWKNESNVPAQTAQHDFMSVRYVNPIANAVRKFDSFNYSLNHYMYFGWEGLYDEGSNRGLINTSQFNEYSILAQIPLNDNQSTSCD